MSADSLVIGRTNAGKTSFCLRFARFLGLRELNWVVERTDGVNERRRMPLSEAESLLSSGEAHRTRELQTLILPVPRGKSERMVHVTDSTGLSDGLHQDVSVRRAMAQTLRQMLDAKVVLHIIDAAALGQALRRSSKEKAYRLDALDAQMLALTRLKSTYVILANKMDLPEANEGYKWLKRELSGERIVPISAREGTGFREVKRHVWRFA